MLLEGHQKKLFCVFFLTRNTDVFLTVIAALKLTCKLLGANKNNYKFKAFKMYDKKVKFLGIFEQ